GFARGAPPLPIPNREVKSPMADGTGFSSGRVGSCHIFLVPISNDRDFFCPYLLYFCFMVFILFPLLLNFFFSLNFKPTQFSIEGSAQGTSYKIIYFNKYERVLKYEIDSIFLALDKSLSVYQPNSLISIFNKQGFVKMDEHLENVVNYSISTFYNSNGIFDITVLPLVNAWGFGTEVHSNAPDSATLKELK